MDAAALWGIGGVLLGAIATFSVNFLLARRTEIHDLKAARRLVCLDLYKTQALIAPVRDRGSWGPEFSELPTGSFNALSATLAKSLSAKEWRQLRGSVMGVNRLEGIRKEAYEDEREMTDMERADFVRIGEHIDDTLRLLDADKKERRPFRG